MTSVLQLFLKTVAQQLEISQSNYEDSNSQVQLLKRLQTTITGTPILLAWLNTDLRYLGANLRWQEALDLPMDFKGILEKRLQLSFDSTGFTAEEVFTSNGKTLIITAIKAHDEINCLGIDVTNNLQSRQDLANKNRQSRIANQIIAKMRSSLTLRSVLNSAVREIREAINCYRVCVYKFTNDNIGIIFAESSLDGGKIVGKQFGDSCLKNSLSQGSISIPDVNNHPSECYKSLMYSIGVRANLTIPIYQQKELWGLLFCHHNQPLDWSPHISFVQEIVDQLAVAIEQAEIYQGYQRREKFLSALRDISTVLIGDRIESFYDNLHAALKIIGTALEIDRCYISINYRNGNKLMSSRYQEWCRDRVEPQTRNQTLIQLDLEKLGEIYHRLSCNDTYFFNRSQANSRDRDFFACQDVLSATLVPIFQQNKFWGFIGYDDCHTEKHWTKDEESILISAASIIGSAAIQYFYQLEEIKEKNLELMRERELFIKGQVVTLRWEFPSFQIKYVSPNLKAQFGYSHLDWLNQSYKNFIVESDREEVLVKIAEGMDSTNDCFEHFYRIYDRDKNVVYWVYTFFKKINESEIDGYILNITQAKEVEQTLEYLMYAISHDLRQPLRGIANLSKMLEKYLIQSFGNNAPEKVIHYSHRIGENIKHLNSIIEAYLVFSRINRRALELESAPIAEIIDDASKHLNDLILESNAEITINNLPTIRCDRFLMIQVFQNLIHNAIKFQPPKAQPSIEISYQETEDRLNHLILVQDNGIGIEQEYWLSIFQGIRLNAPEEYPGVGMGLTIVTRILRKHNGKIWVSSSPQGSIFFICLPK